MDTSKIDKTLSFWEGFLFYQHGTIPIVRKTGGLADTIRDAENGFVFIEHTKGGLISAIEKAFDAFEDKKAWNKMVKDGMKEDFSWKRSVKEYMEIYKFMI